MSKPASGPSWGRGIRCQLAQGDGLRRGGERDWDSVLAVAERDCGGVVQDQLKSQLGRPDQDRIPAELGREVNKTVPGPDRPWHRNPQGYRGELPLGAGQERS